MQQYVIFNVLKEYCIPKEEEEEEERILIFASSILELHPLNLNKSRPARHVEPRCSD